MVPIIWRAKFIFLQKKPQIRNLEYFSLPYRGTLWYSSLEVSRSVPRKIAQEFFHYFEGLQS